MPLVTTVLTDAYISIGGNVISDHANKVEIALSAEEKEITAFGQTFKVRAGGTLKDAKLSITLYNNVQAAALDSLMYPLLGTVVAFEVRPTSAARSTSNAATVGNVFISELKPLSGGVGDVNGYDVSWPTSGTITHPTA